VFDDVPVNPRTTTAEQVAGRAAGHGVVIGFGGGSVLDAAKAGAMLATNEGRALDFVGKNKFGSTPLPFIAVPTTCGTGSEVTWVSVLTDLEASSKISIKGDGMFPDVALVDADLVTGLLARQQIRRHGKGRVLYDLRSSRATAEEIESAGGEAEMCRVGHSFVKARMREVGAIFAGELSGHFYFRFSPTLVADDGIAAFVALLDVLGSEERPLSELVAPLRRYSASGEINRRVDAIEPVLAAIEAEHADAAEISHLDGLYVRYDDWWFNLRPSNTEPVLRLNLEAGTPERMAKERDALLERIGGEIP